MSEPVHEVDDILLTIGLGKWQITQYVLLVFVFIPWAHATLAIIILGFVPDFACLPPDYNSTVHNNLTSATSLNLTYGQSCEWFDGVTNSTEACAAGYVYAEPKEASVVSEWDLVCGRTFLSELSQTILTIGLCCGTVVFSPMADKYGRRNMVIWCHVAMFVTGLLNAVAMNMTAFIIARFFFGAFLAGSGMVSWVLILELFVPKHRTLAALISNIIWGVSVTTLPALGYLMKGLSWRYVQAAMMSLSLIVIVQYFYVDESLRWLMANGRDKEAVKVIKKIAKTNGVSSENVSTIISRYFYVDKGNDAYVYRRQGEVGAKDTSPEKDDLIFEETEGNATGISPKDLITHVRLRRISLLMCLAWFTNSLTYSGIYMLASALSGDRYMNLFLSAVVEIPSGIILVPIVLRFGRRKVLVAIHFMAAVSLITAAVVHVTSGGPVAHIVFTGVIMLGKFSIGSAYNLIYMYTPEVYPTNIRSFGVGLATTASRLGGFLAPFAATVARHIPWLPAAVFGGLCLVVACLCPLLPETLNKDLPQTLADLDKLFSSDTRRKEIELKSPTAI